MANTNGSIMKCKEHLIVPEEAQSNSIALLVNDTNGCINQSGRNERTIYVKWELILALLNEDSSAGSTIKERAWKLKVSINDLVSDLIELSILEETGETCVKFCKDTDFFQKIYNWTGQHRDVLKMMSGEQLAYLNNIVSMAGTCILVTKELVIPMMLILLSLKPTEKRTVPPDLEALYVKLLYSISQRISDNQFLEILALDNFTPEGFKIPKFTFFELLLLYVHRSGQNGDQARDAILLCIRAAKCNVEFLKYIVDISSGCVVIAGGLSARYSSLPTTLEIQFEDWNQISHADLKDMIELKAFLKTLNFCCDVVKVADQKIQFNMSLLIHDGFCLSVLAPALNQTLVDAQVAVIAYLELFLRQITCEQVMEVFLKVLLTDAYDNKPLIDLLIQHINSSSAQLSMVALQFFKTLLHLNCEDVMFHLILRYLLPCNHILPNQKRTIKELDFYCKSATMFLYLTPNCCLETKVDFDDNLFDEDFPKLLKSGSSTSPSLHSRVSQLSRSSSGSSQMSRCNSGDSIGTEKCPNVCVDFMTYTTEARAILQTFKAASESWSAVYDGMDVMTERDQIRLSSRVSESGTRMSFLRPGHHSRSFLGRSISANSDNSKENMESNILTESIDSDVCAGVSEVATPKYSTECVGPFLNALFDRLEDMLENDVYVNLQLTSLVSSLVCYPQPLLRSYFLSANLVIRPEVRSFIKILSDVAASVDAYLLKKDDFRSLITNARRNLAIRGMLYNTDIDSLDVEDDHFSITVDGRSAECKFQKDNISITSDYDVASLIGFRMNDLRSSSMIFSKAPEDLLDNRSLRTSTISMPHSQPGRLHPFLPRNNKSPSKHSPKISRSAQCLDAKRAENYSALNNAVYCAVILEEFMKELAAISIEHTLL